MTKFDKVKEMKKLHDLEVEKKKTQKMQLQNLKKIRGIKQKKNKITLKIKLKKKKSL